MLSSSSSFILYLSILIYYYLYSSLINKLTPHVLFVLRVWAGGGVLGWWMWCGVLGIYYILYYYITYYTLLLYYYIIYYTLISFDLFLSPFIPSSSPSFRVFPSFSTYLSFPSFSSPPPNSFYTCRYFYILTYIPFPISPSPHFILYLSGLTYTYLYSLIIWSIFSHHPHLSKV